MDKSLILMTEGLRILFNPFLYHIFNIDIRINHRRKQSPLINHLNSYLYYSKSQKNEEMIPNCFANKIRAAMCLTQNA